MRLIDYLAEQKTQDAAFSNATFAERIGVSVQALSRYRLGHRKPEWAILERIREVTGGAVTPNDFLGAQPQAEVA